MTLKFRYQLEKPKKWFRVSVINLFSKELTRAPTAGGSAGISAVGESVECV